MNTSEVLKTDKKLYDFLQDNLLRGRVEKLMEEYHKKKLSLCSVSKRLSIKLEDWDYECSDGCCSMFGTEIALNEKKCDNQYAGGDVRTSLEFVLRELGYEVDIDVY